MESTKSHRPGVRPSDEESRPFGHGMCRLPDNVRRRLPEPEKLEAYLPKITTMEPSLWASRRDAFLALLAEVSPRRLNDTRQVLSVMCRFYSWALNRRPELSVVGAFSWHRIQDFLAELEPSQRVNTKARLSRVVRAIDGQDKAPNESPPLRQRREITESHLRRIVIEAADHSSLARVVAVALATGWHGKDAIGQPIPSAPVLMRVLAALGVPSNLATQIDTSGPPTLGPLEGAQARRHAQAVCCALPLNALVDCWARALLQASEPAIVTLRRYSLPVGRLDRALHESPTPDTNHFRDLLRSFSAPENAVER